MTNHNEDDAVSLQFEMEEIIHEETGLHSELSAQIASRIYNGIVKRFKGLRVYVGQNDKLTIAERNKEIRQRNDGTPATRKALMKEFGVSKSTFYRIIGED